MKKLLLNDPCTFFTTDCDIKIYDHRKKIFYFHPNKSKSITFNLPKGVYFTDCLFTQKVFSPYEEYKAPTKLFDFSSYDLISKPNPNKATISLKKKTITVDPKFSNHDYLPCQQFILGHEIYHNEVGGNIYDKSGKLIFDAEQACDDFSSNYMLSHGWNPSQVYFACKLLLKSEDRCCNTANNTIHKHLRR